MRYRPVTFAIRSAKHDSEPQSSSERLVNCFAEQGTEERPLIVRSCPGLDRIIAGSGSPVRAMRETVGAIYYVAGGQLYSFDGTASTALGAVPDDPQTTLAWNGTELAVVADGAYRLWNGSTMATIAGQAFTEFGSVAFMDGYFLFTEQDGGRHCISHLYDGATLDALDFASAEYQPDPIIRGFVDHSEWWLFGARTVEIWTNTGAADYPFEKVRGTEIETGCLQPNTVAALDNTVFWVGNDGIVWRADQYRPARVSDHRVEAAIHAASGALSAFVYEYEGHKFYALRIDGRPAWVYDAATQLWHERASGQAFGAWMATASARLGQTWYLGTDEGDICKVDRVWQERGETFRRWAQSKPLTMGGSRFKVASADVRVKAATGATVMVEHSWDGGMTWSRERFFETGATGEYGTRLQVHRLGQGREFALRVSCSDDADFAVYGAGVVAA